MKNLDYYLELNYDRKIKKIIEEGELFYRVTTSELDELSFYGIGSTIEDALNNFEEVKKELFEIYLDGDLEIPEPKVEEDELLPSGKFIVRIAPMTHKGLIEEARKNNQSLNSFINSIFDRFSTSNELLEVLKDEIKKLTLSIPKEQTLIYNLNPSKLAVLENKKEDEYAEQAADAA